MPDIAAIAKFLPPELYRPAPVEIHQLQQDDIRIEYHFQEADLEKRTGRFWGGVRAYYGLTVLECDELFVNFGEQTGRAVGKVSVHDPEGALQGDNLEFDWRARTGSAENIKMEISGVRLRADKLEIAPGRWVAHQVHGTASQAKTPDIEFEAERLVITPGQGGSARKPAIVVFGHKLGTIPNYGFTLAKGETGIRLPFPSYKPGGGIRVSWGGTAQLSPSTLLSHKMRLFQDRPALLQTELTHRLSGDPEQGIQRPRSDLSERFSEGWFDSSVVRTPAEEVEALFQRSQVIALGSHYGVATRARLVDGERLSKPLEAVYEAKGKLSTDFAGLLQLRYQRVDAGGDLDSVNRGTATIAIRSREIPLVKHLGLVLGGDGSILSSRDQTYAWSRATGYFLVRPDAHLTLGIGGSIGFDVGRAHYDFDRNWTDQSFHLRADLTFGNVDLITLFKYDARRGRWYDTEVALQFVAGSIEPFVRYRQFPNQLTFGASLRIHDFIETLRRRSLRPRSGPSEGK